MLVNTLFLSFQWFVLKGNFAGSLRFLAEFTGVRLVELPAVIDYICILSTELERGYDVGQPIRLDSVFVPGRPHENEYSLLYSFKSTIFFGRIERASSDFNDQNLISSQS